MMMLSSRRPEAHQKPLQISNDEKFFARILSKEISASAPSFRIYYGVSAAGAVPFHWESQPGTPKYATSTATLPPLTPPPSYYFISPNNPSKSPKITKLNRIHSILPRLAPPKKPHYSPSPSQLSSSSTASSASSRSHRRGHFSSPVSSFSSNSKSCDEGFDEGLSTSSTLSLRRRPHAGGKSGWYSLFVMKNVLLCIVGHGSAAC